MTTEEQTARRVLSAHYPGHDFCLVAGERTPDHTEAEFVNKDGGAVLVTLYADATYTHEYCPPASRWKSTFLTVHDLADLPA